MLPNIALYAPTQQSGKSQAALHLSSTYSYAAVKFAGTLKGMFWNLLDDLGFDHAMKVSMIEGDLKETPFEELGGKTPRFCMQTLGSEWGRHLIDDDLWIRLAMIKVKQMLSRGYPSVIDDLRFPNEYVALEKAGFKFVKLVRPGVVRVGDHASEGLLDHYPFDLEIINDGSILDLREKIDVFLNGQGACPRP